MQRYGWEIDPEDSRGPTLHGLRGAAVMERRRQGYEAQAIYDIGMSLPMVMRYTRFMDQMDAAESNRRRFEMSNRDVHRALVIQLCYSILLNAESLSQASLPSSLLHPALDGLRRQT
ncbi:hypothetical protein [Microvirga vignae]|uniref:hypothetical protein n=1 Tax=Microvirga vignae TaxID=1225564 RepID=UPI001364A5E8|nr:hypothetical protein [Microvirga vignae]